MKYIKTFEKIKPKRQRIQKYKKGDFIKFNDKNFSLSLIGKIVKIIKTQPLLKSKNDYNFENFYKIHTFDKQDDFYITIDNIERKLTEEEAELFLSTKKYNI